VSWRKINSREVIAIFTLLIALVAVLGLRQGCAQGVSNLFKAFETPLDAGVRHAEPR
jgi:hypothetical protein